MSHSAPPVAPSSSTPAAAPARTASLKPAAVAAIAISGAADGRDAATPTSNSPGLGGTANGTRMGRKLDASAPTFKPSFGGGSQQQQLSTSRGRSEASLGAIIAAGAGRSGGVQTRQQLRPSTSSTEQRISKPAVPRGGPSWSSNKGDGRHGHGVASSRTEGGGRGSSSGTGGGRGGRRSRNDGSFSAQHDVIAATDEAVIGKEAGRGDVSGQPSARSHEGGTRRQRRLSEGSSSSRAGLVTGAAADEGEEGASNGGASVTTAQQGRASGGGKSRKKLGSGGNANHLLNFQFQPISGGHEGGGDGGRNRRGGGGGVGRKSGGVWGGGSARGPMSKEQFLQANFHFLLHDPAWTNNSGRSSSSSSSSPILQEAFFDPDVLVDWDTVDTVRLFRKILRRDEAFSPADAGTAGPLISAEEKPAADENSQISPAPPTENRTAEPNAPVSGTTPAKKKGQPVQEEVAWGSANRRSSPASPEHKVASSSADRTKGNAGSNGNNNGSKGNNNGNNGAKGDKGGSVSVGKISVDGEGRDDEEWRCPICLGQPIAPRVTKCGHGPFCLVCILRHLKGEGSARCPLCFDLMHRDRLRRAICEEIRPYMPRSTARLLLLQRERTSLVPHAAAAAAAAAAASGGQEDPAGGSEGGKTTYAPPCDMEAQCETGWAAGVCPREGDDAERFSRLVRANPSTLHDLAFAEATLLHGFRVDSINSGETEWVPYVSQAQALVNAQLARFSSLPAAEAACAQRLPASQWLSVADRRVGRGSEQELRLERRRAKVGDTGGSGAKSADSGSDGVARVSDRENARGGAGDEHDNDEGGEADKEQSDGASGGGAGAPGAGGGRGAGVEGGNYFRFFQSCDGQKAFLHPLDMRQLLDDAEKGMPLPQRIDAPVLEVETVKLTPELRRRLPFLGHLPIHCDISFLELDMQGFISEATTKKFHEETQKRERKRRARAAQEARAAAKEALAERKRSARIAAMREFTVDLRGPKPGHIERLPVPPMPPTMGGVDADNISTAAASAAATVDAAATATAIATALGVGDSTDSASRGASSGAAVGAGGAAEGAVTTTSDQENAVDGGGGGGGTGWSFARVTAMNGHFPSLNPTGPGAASAAGGSGGRVVGGGAWGSGANGEQQGGGAWGTLKTEGVAGRSDPLRLSEGVDGVGRKGVGGDGAPLGENGVAGGGGAGAAKKKGKKGKKAVSLFSNAGVRGGR